MNLFEKLNSFILNTLIKKVANYGIEKHHLAAFYFTLSNLVLFVFLPWLPFAMLKFYVLLAPFVLPYVLYQKIWTYWMVLKRSEFLLKQDKILFEIILPGQIKQGPEAMEEFLSAIHVNPGESTFIAKYIKGSTRPYWSFELVSIEGELHMYIWTWSKFAEFIKAEFYAQYPDAELVEVEDYLNGLEPDLERFGIWGTDYKLMKADAYPIKSYKEWGLNKLDSTKDRDSVPDPLNSVFEKFASLDEGEMAILHIMFQYTRNKSWQDEVKKTIDKIYESRTEKFPSFSNPDEEVQGFAQLRPHEWDLVNTLKHSTEKDAYDVGIRSLYIARKDKFKPGERVGPNHVNLFRSFESPHLNDLKGIAHWLAGYDYPWHDPRQKKQNALRRKIIDAMKRRSYFHTPYVFDSFVLTTEELATLFHLPISRKILNLFTKKEWSKAPPPNNLPT